MCCGGNNNRKKLFDDTDINNPVAFKRQVYEKRINSCRSCGNFVPTTWFCSLISKDIRPTARDMNGKCSLPNGRW